MVDPAKYPRILPPYIMFKELMESALKCFLLLVFLTEGLSVFLGMAWLSSSGILKSKGVDCRQRTRKGCGTESVWASADWYLVVLGQYRAVRVDI